MNSSEENANGGFQKTSSGWESTLIPFALQAEGRVYNSFIIEVSRDNGVTWEEVTTSIFGRRQLSTWNSNDFQNQEIYGSHIFAQSNTGNLVRARYRMKGANQNIKSISYFAK